MTLVLLLFLNLNPAHAGWWSDFCERHLIAIDPYQYEDLSDAQLVREYERALDDEDGPLIRVLDREFARRRQGRGE